MSVLLVGVPVSSLYGAPSLIHEGFPRYSHILMDLAFTDIPESFNLPFGEEAARLQGGALTS